jgi:hypothetical protein
LSAEEKAEEEKNIGTTNALGKITQAGYTSLDVSLLVLCDACSTDIVCHS